MHGIDTASTAQAAPRAWAQILSIQELVNNIMPFLPGVRPPWGWSRKLIDR
jgi:hypothetical protein